jgi:hypothetical protein
MRRLQWLPLAAALAASALLGPDAEANRSFRSSNGDRGFGAGAGAQPSPMEVARLVRDANRDRMQRVRGAGAIFQRIVDGDHRNSHVVHDGKGVKAFLSLTDPKHPKHDKDMDPPDGLEKIPVQKRAHVLVVPKEPREHIGRRLSGAITKDDLEKAHEVMAEAHKIAKALGIANPSIFVNTLDRLAVGFLHVHIVGEKTQPYPTPIPGKPQQGSH